MTAAGNKVDAGHSAPIEDEFSILATRDQLPADFFRRFLAHILSEVSASAAAAWGINQHGVLAKICEIHQPSTGAKETPAGMRRRINRLIELVAQGATEPQVVRTPVPAEHGQQTCHVLLLIPLRHGDCCVGAIEVFLPNDMTDAVAAEQLRRVVDLAQHAARYVTRQMRLSPASDPTAAHRQLDELTLRLHQSLDMQCVAFTAVNEGRLLLGCDRLTLAVRSGGNSKIAAISGQDHAARRSNLVRAMNEVADLVVESSQPIYFAGDAETLPPQIQEKVVDYAAESGARTIEAIPVCKHRLPDERDGSTVDDETIAVLLLEHMTEARPKSTSKLTEVFSERVASALHNALRYQRATGFVPGWLVDKFYGTRGSEKTTRVALAGVIVFLAVACLAVVPVPFRVEAKGTLIPVRRSRVFAPHDGIVRNVAVEGGQGVSKGQLLLQIENEQLATRLLETQNRFREKQQYLAMLAAKSSDVLQSGQQADAIQLRGSIAQTEIEIDSLRERLAALQRERGQLEVRSAQDGNVATYQPQQRLLDRPVNRGELLLEVMNPNGPWQLELDLPARRAGHIFAAQRAVANGELPVDFVLETMPDQSFAGTVQRVSSTATIGTDRSVTFPVDVAVDAAELPDRLAGAQVRAHIRCGRRQFAYVLFGDVYDFFRRHVW